MNMKKLIALLLTMVMVFGLAACGGNDTPAADAPAAGSYQVKVVDAFGNPVTSGVIVRYMQNGQQVSMQVVNEEGIVTKDLADGEYTVELQFTDKNAAYYYDQTDLKLASASDSLEITLYHALSGEPQTVFAYSPASDGNKDYEVYSVTVGGTYVELAPGERNYFLFTPTEGGMYEFSVQNSQATIGYYGGTHLVQQFSIVEPVDNVITESIKDSMIGTNGTGTTVMVLGLDAAAEDTSAILTIQRIGEPEWTVEDEPWHVYKATHTLTPYVHDGSALGEFDLRAATDTYNLVLGDDGYYHMDSEDGPLVLVRLGENSGGSKYLDAFQVITDHSGVTKYFYDEEGNFVKRESYTECLMEYYGYMDEETGLYPLTEDLKYIIQQRGDHYGWFDVESPGYIFLDENGNPIRDLNHEISWLFYCCYCK